MKTTWDFVEKYYPNYYSCSDITLSDDLKKILDGEQNGEASKIYNEIRADLMLFHGCFIGDEEELENLINGEVERMYSNVMFDIYRKSITAYIKTLSL